MISLSNDSQAKPIALVTGGGGFLGSGIVRQLLQDSYSVRSVSRSSYAFLEDLGVQTVQGDLADLKVCQEAVRGVDIVFHVAAKAGIWGDREDYYNANVQATQNLLRACTEQGVKKFVFTSSPSVVFAGNDQEGVSEAEPYPQAYLSEYSRTKAQAEQLVLQANCKELATVALRPHLIWGPGDNHLVPRLIERAKAGKLRLLGKDSKLVDSVYIDNAVDAHILAAERLQYDTIGGKAYFISQDEPWTMEQLINRILEAGGQQAVNKKIPAGLAYFLGAALEGVYKVLGKKEEPRMTRFLARQLATAHWFDISAAKRDLGYTPKLSMEEGLERLAKSLGKDPS